VGSGSIPYGVEGLVMLCSSRLKVVLAFAIAAVPYTVVAQRSSGTSSKPPATTNLPPTRTQPGTDPNTQPIFVSGRVLLDGGSSLPEPVPIERVCNGIAHREGYTDSRGAFQIQLGQNIEFQDASSSDPNILKIPSPKTTAGTGQDAARLQYLGCEFRAQLPGFRSSSVLLKLQGSTWQYDVGTIFLKRQSEVKGSTVSLTTMSAPKDARHALEKGEKAYSQNKFSDAEKELNKAVELYPGLAAAWSLLGDIHHQQNEFDQAAKEYSKATAIDPQFVNPEFGLALIATQQKRWHDAVTLTNQVVKLNSLAFPSAYFYNAVANYNLGNFDAAEESAHKYKSLDASDHHHPDICLLLSEVMVRKQDYTAAAQEMREYLAIRPDAPNAAALREKIKSLEDLSVANK
jgi:tetratricopeptide (TPR) repeat protein